MFEAVSPGEKKTKEWASPSRAPEMVISADVPRWMPERDIETASGVAALIALFGNIEKEKRQITRAETKFVLMILFRFCINGSYKGRAINRGMTLPNMRSGQSLDRSKTFVLDAEVKPRCLE
jgi:hypothetical protein